MRWRGVRYIDAGLQMTSRICAAIQPRVSAARGAGAHLCDRDVCRYRSRSASERRDRQCRGIARGIAHGEHGIHHVCRYQRCAENLAGTGGATNHRVRKIGTKTHAARICAGRGCQVRHGHHTAAIDLQQGNGTGIILHHKISSGWRIDLHIGSRSIQNGAEV